MILIAISRLMRQAKGWLGRKSGAVFIRTATQPSLLETRRQSVGHILGLLCGDRRAWRSFFLDLRGGLPPPWISAYNRALVGQIRDRINEDVHYWVRIAQPKVPEQPDDMRLFDFCGCVRRFIICSRVSPAHHEEIIRLLILGVTRRTSVAESRAEERSTSTESHASKTTVS